MPKKVLIKDQVLKIRTLLETVVFTQPARQLDVPGEAEVCENDVELESDSILSPVDAIGHPLVDLVHLVYKEYNAHIKTHMYRYISYI